MWILSKFKALSSVRKTVIVLSISALMISLAQPAFYIDGNDYDAWASSPYLLFLGWLGVLGGSTERLLWIANPLYFYALYLFITNNKLSVFASALAVFMALLFSTLPTILTSESGTRSKIASFEPGYKLWVTSFIILFIGTVISIIIERKYSANNSM